MAENIDVKELTQKYGAIKSIECDNKIAYFKKPDLKIWRFASKAIEKSHTEFKRTIAINCFVAGDKSLLESPYIEDISDVIDEFINYVDAEIEKDGNAYIVRVADKECRLRPITIEFQTLAERQNPSDTAFLTQQNLLKLLWLSGDSELQDSANLDYYMPVLRVLKDLRDKHVLNIKNV